MARARDVLTTKQRVAIEDVKQACAECDTHMNALESLGLNIDERRALNAERRAAVERIEQIAAAHNQQG